MRVRTVALGLIVGAVIERGFSLGVRKSIDSTLGLVHDASGREKTFR